MMQRSCPVAAISAGGSSVTAANEYRSGLPGARQIATRRRIMGKYVLGWFLGIPAIVLVILYMIFH